MKAAIIVAEKDPAGMSIKDSLLNLFAFEELNEKLDGNPVFELEKCDKKIRLYTTEKDSVFCENIDKKIDAGLFVFATRHSAKAGLKTLCVHTPGNWSKAEYGGRDKKLCMAASSYIKECFFILNELGEDLGYEKSLEATHHGPLIEKPCFFIEIGSSEEEWGDKKAAHVVAKTIVTLLGREDRKEKRECKTAIGIGGPHYAYNFNKVVLKTDICIGHICPKYALQYLDGEMIKQAIEKTHESVDFALLDWKGLGKEKQKIVGLLKKLNIEYKRTDQLD
jgi:D-aminoacyl-tRNA deacylase